MSAARNSLVKQTRVASGYVNYNGALSKGSLSATPGQLAAGQVRISQNILELQNDLRDVLNINPDDLIGPPGPPGKDGIVNVNYSEDIADEFPVFSVQSLASKWTLSDVNHRNADISTNHGFMPLGGLFSDSLNSVSYPIYDTSAGTFIPFETSSYSNSVSTSTTTIPGFVTVPFHTDRIVQNISWTCPQGIVARFVILGKPSSGSNYWTKYYQI